MSKGRDKGGLIPVIVIGLVLFVSYQSNPEAWKQGKLFNDLMKTTSSSAVETNDVANIPQQVPAEKPYDGNSSSASSTPQAEPSISGAKPLPGKIYENFNDNNPVFRYLVSPKKLIYFCGVKSPRNSALLSAIADELKSSGIDSDYGLIANFFESNEELKAVASSNHPNYQQSYLAKNCSRNVCIISAQRKEIIQLPLNSTAIASKAKQIIKW